MRKLVGADEQCRVLDRRELGDRSIEGRRQHFVEVRRLFRDYKQEEQTYFQQTGIFPISHVIAMDRAFVERYMPHSMISVPLRRPDAALSHHHRGRSRAARARRWQPLA